ncbi:hypothetical protein B0H66DRAFT_639273 [Apodospora peruviana]|uniref:Uncharacterized protein n=1 Tax=Apodospora peruviana TaxID=516989 RepID=A0AAE0M8M8_9PEZI|nr:hypothetical protein B0H66DRAFT_639273 [Apodospora peruviana]
MKTLSIIPAAAATIALFAGSSAAFWGQLNLVGRCPGEGCFTYLTLRDYNTGSTYDCGIVNPGYCNSPGKCTNTCTETSPGGYNFNVQYWQTSDGCENVDFLGALDAHHGWCCGGVPCDIGA